MKGKLVDPLVVEDYFLLTKEDALKQNPIFPEWFNYTAKYGQMGGDLIWICPKEDDNHNYNCEDFGIPNENTIVCKIENEHIPKFYSVENFNHIFQPYSVDSKEVQIGDKLHIKQKGTTGIGNVFVLGKKYDLIKNKFQFRVCNAWEGNGNSQPFYVWEEELVKHFKCKFHEQTR